jgi:hypothetical protein
MKIYSGFCIHLSEEIFNDNLKVITIRFSRWILFLFKNICQTKAKYKFLLCCCSYLNDESEKTNTSLSDYQTVGLMACRNIATLMDGDTDRKFLRKPNLNQINSIGVYYSIDGSCKKHTSINSPID